MEQRHQGVLADPAARHPFRARVRAALLACPRGVVGDITAARLHALRGLPQWTPAELPVLLLPRGCTYDARAGVTLRVTDLRDQVTRLSGLPVVTVGRAVLDVVPQLDPIDAVALCDSALARGWTPDPGAGTRARSKLLRQVLRVSDGRSESVLETRIRLILLEAGLMPEALQYEVRNARGGFVARLDMAWPSVRLALEADGKAFHDVPEAVYRDRRRSNDLGGLGWRVLRFTWADLQSPRWIVQQVRRALGLTDEPTP